MDRSRTRHGIRGFYNRIAPRYGIVNHLFTWGLDFYWRRAAARTAVIPEARRYLDLCTGTGEMAVCLKRRLQGEALVVGTDFSVPMLNRCPSDLLRAASEAGRLPFADGSFDIVTLSFATRNLRQEADYLRRCLVEVHRVLRPGGRFVHLETSQPLRSWVRRLFHLYVRAVVFPIGRLMTGAAGPYAFLSKSICDFHDAESLATLFRECGFTNIRYRYSLFGAVAIHQAEKP